MFTKADLRAADLSDTFISEADFSADDLSFSNLSGAMIGGNFAGADLTRSHTHAGTTFGGYLEGEGVQLNNKTSLLDVAWNGAILALVDWNTLPRLGDESGIKEAPNHTQRIEAYRQAARAYRGLANALEARVSQNQY